MSSELGMRIRAEWHFQHKHLLLFHMLVWSTAHNRRLPSSTVPILWILSSHQIFFLLSNTGASFRPKPFVSFRTNFISSFHHVSTKLTSSSLLKWIWNLSYHTSLILLTFPQCFSTNYTHSCTSHSTFHLCTVCLTFSHSQSPSKASDPITCAYAAHDPPPKSHQRFSTAFAAPSACEFSILHYTTRYGHWHLLWLFVGCMLLLFVQPLHYVLLIYYFTALLGKDWTD